MVTTDPDVKRLAPLIAVGVDFTVTEVACELDPSRGDGGH